MVSNGVDGEHTMTEYDAKTKIEFDCKHCDYVGKTKHDVEKHLRGTHGIDRRQQVIEGR